MTRPETDWSDLTEAWTASSDPQPPLDARLIRSLRRRDRLARINFAFEMAAGVFVLAAMGWVLWRGGPLPAVAAAGAFALFALAMTLWSRRGDPGLLTETPEAVLHSALGQARTGFRWAVAGIAISLAAMLFLTVMMLVLTPARAPSAAVTAGAGVALVLCIAFYERHARRCRRRMAAHQAALDALTEKDGGPLNGYDRF
ncbi:MAG: hypothetical protein Q8S03_12390 [Brevundimonas sp.]|uniref:hypothetical protein n=1 Tax=Brevundimonas sp. TaxID=1871086 RepID=UPI0027360D8D|nr:hypothetical protein [Brevundimonas sp.]MDP3405484.1 hypothetical protein [Brevundimonas sp.]